MTDRECVYVAIWVDRHAEPDAYVFSDADSAIAWAARQARENDRHDELDETLTEGMRRIGWLYHGSYSGEGDFLYVVEREVQS